MKRVLSVLFVLAAIVTLNLNVLNAAAKPPKPPADCGKDADHDGWCVADSSRTMTDPADATKTVPFLVGVLDCNDADSKVNPGASEKLDDGIDNDCVDGDLETPAYIKAWGCSSAKCVSRVLDEIETCEANKEKCAVNLSEGKFVMAWGSYFVDTDCDGIREVLDQDEMDTYEDDLREGSKRRCGSSSGAKKAGAGATGAASASGGTSGATASKPAATDPKFEERLGKTEAGLTELGGRTDKIGSDLIGLVGDLGDLDRALNEETAAREKNDEVLSNQISRVGERVSENLYAINGVRSRVDSVEHVATSAYHNAEAAHYTGVSAGVDVGFALIGQADVSLKGGKEARPGLAPTVLLGGHVGAELESGLYRAFGAVGVPYEAAPAGHTENGLLLTAGTEALFKLSLGSAHSVGPIVRFIEHESGGDVLGVNAKSRGATGGIAYEFDPQFGSFRVPIHISLEGGAEQVGTQGTDDGSKFKAIGVVPMGMLSLTFGAGTGSAIR
jgi:hypothetical protein